MNDDTVLFLTDEELDSSTGGQTISYGALARNRVGRGSASPVQPYHRGCSPATQCRS